MKKLRLFFVLISTGAVLGLSLPSAHALPVTGVSETSFGPLSQATFGGNGIPNDQVSITQSNGITLGTTVTGRYANPTPTNNGAGVFTVTAGGDTINGAPLLAKWNFDMYASGLPTGSALTILWDLNPAVGNTYTNSLFLGQLNINDSENFGFNPFNGGGLFNPNTTGEFGIGLLVTNVDTGATLAYNSILVNVQGGNAAGVPDTGPTIILLVMGFVSMFVVRQYFRGHSNSIASPA